jgi:hypothetical protein
MDTKTWLRKARQLRAAMFEDEAAFFLFLVDGEAGGVAWRGVVDSFEELLNDLCDVSRYVAFRNAIAIVDRAHAKHIGVDGVIVASRQNDTVKRDKIVRSLEEARGRLGHPLSRQETIKHAQTIAPVGRDTPDLRRAMNRDKLEQENVSLRKRVREGEGR